jgi:hypothetical protein
MICTASRKSSAASPASAPHITSAPPELSFWRHFT